MIPLTLTDGNADFAMRAAETTRDPSHPGEAPAASRSGVGQAPQAHFDWMRAAWVGSIVWLLFLVAILLGAV